MRHTFKKLISLVLVLSISLAISVPAFAATKDNDSNNIINIAEAFKNYAQIYKQNHDSNSDAAQILSNFYAEKKKDANAIVNKISSQEIIPINRNQEIIFDGNLVYLKTSKIIPKKTNTLNTNTSKSEANLNSASATWNYTDTYSDSVSIYGNVFGNWLFTVSQDAQFRYNYSTSECISSDGNYEFSPMNIWQVSDWQDSKVTTPHHDGYNWSYVKSQGHFHYGFETNGAGLVMGNVNAWAYVECNPSGSVSHSANYNSF